MKDRHNGREGPSQLYHFFNLSLPRSLIVATESRDRYTAGHNFRVALFALRLGEAVGLPPEQMRVLAQGAIIHEVGKIAVPDRMLNKPGRLTPEERLEIEQHPVTGFEMCRRLGFMPEELQVILHHHERWDGTGYPHGLRRTEIQVLARLLAVVDVYDALTSTRSYRSAWSHEDAIAYLQEQAGRQFDARFVEAWLRVASEQPPAVTYPAWVPGMGAEEVRVAR